MDESLPSVDLHDVRILSLSHSAMMHLGEAPDPESGKIVQSLPLARQTIDTRRHARREDPRQA